MGDGPVRTAEAVLARLGVAADTAIPALAAVGLWSEEGPRPQAWPVVDAVSASCYPDLALAGVMRLADRNPEGFTRVCADEKLLQRLACVVAASEALAVLLTTSPGALDVLLGDLEPTTAETVRAAGRALLQATEDPVARSVALTRLQRHGLLRIAARDLVGLADTARVTCELADLAEGLLAAALDVVLVEREDGDVRLAVVGMGKLGGQELNYVSDVDVIFVADGDWAAGTRLAERLLRLLGTVTPDGRAYEVDTNLRPEGRDGPLVRSLDAYAAYYERWAKPWEFQALLKARPIAGDGEVGQRFTELVEPHLWPDRLEGRVVEEIQRLKGVVEGSRAVRRAGARQVKLAPGGLRDIEFAVQLLQLVHGRHDRSLRSPNTLAALAALAEGGYVDEGDANLFGDAYQFLRTVEHRLQLHRLRRTHTVPESAEERYRLARAAGFRDVRAATALAQFDREYARVRGYVRRLHEQLFYRPLLSRFAELSSSEQMAVADGDHRLAEHAARDRLAALGFTDPDGALRHLDALASGISRRARLFRTLLPALLPTLAAAPDPDSGLAAFRSLADRLGDSSSFLRTLRDSPPVGELLVRVLGASPLVGEWLERQPEVVGRLVDLPALARGVTAEEYRRLADGLVRRRGDPDDAAEALRRLRRREAARVAVRDLSGHADVAGVGEELTGVAEACLEAAVGLTVPAGVRLAVIGMGKLGGRELGYASDLDVLLVFEPADAREDAIRAAEALLRLLSGITPEGKAFRVDANLRPEGKDGPLARTLDSYRAYYERWAAAWELQALTQARPVAGDVALGRAFIDAVADLVYPELPPAERLAEVRRMKARVERERGGTARRATRLHWSAARRPAPAKDLVNLKLGPGGMSDVEWTAQLLQLQLGGRLPGLRVPGTRAALQALEKEGVLDGRDVLWLRDGLTLQSRIRNALYLAGFRNTDRLPAGAQDVERIARMLGYPAPGLQAFREDITRVRRRVRKVHERLFYAS